jgi:hypothetical protein
LAEKRGEVPLRWRVAAENFTKTLPNLTIFTFLLPTVEATCGHLKPPKATENKISARKINHEIHETHERKTDFDANTRGRKGVLIGTDKVWDK